MKNKIEEIRSHYNLHGNQRIFNLNDDRCEFEMYLGDVIMTLPYPLRMARDTKITKLLEPV